MFQNQSFRLGPNRVPKLIKWTILTTLIVSFFAIFLHGLFTKQLGIPGPQHLLSLSNWGIDKFFIWQFISYLFVQPISDGISFSLILHIFFNLYLLWAIGSSILKMRGVKHFIGLYFLGGLFLGIIAYLSLHFSGSPIPFAGSTTSIYILLIAWAFLNPEAHIMLFLAIPIKARWLVFGIIGFNLIIDFSNGNLFSFLVTAAALFYGYFYSLLIWEILSPFPKLHPFEKKLIYLKRKTRNSIRPKIAVEEHDSNIYDFKTGKIFLDDDSFMDSCLKKISKNKRLSLREKWRMRRISKNKIQNN